MSRHFDSQLQELRQKLALMGRLTQSILEMSLRALSEPEAGYSPQIVQKELEVDQLQLEIDALAVKITALNQPVGADIRFLFMASKIAEEFERIADHAVDIERCVRIESAAGQHGSIVDLLIMAEVTQRMFDDVLVAMIGMNGGILEKIEKSEEEINAFRDRIVGELTQNMSTGGVEIPAALMLISVSRSLERIGDHAVSIGMELAYIESGKDVRHMATTA